jgi:hypothetical protein
MSRVISTREPSDRGTPHHRPPSKATPLSAGGCPEWIGRIP